MNATLKNLGRRCFARYKNQFSLRIGTTYKILLNSSYCLTLASAYKHYYSLGYLRDFDFLNISNICKLITE